MKLDVKRLLLEGAIRVNRGHGHRFYEALHAATKDELEWALTRLTSKYGKYMYSYQPQRVRLIMAALNEMEPSV